MTDKSALVNFLKYATAFPCTANKQVSSDTSFISTPLYWTLKSNSSPSQCSRRSPPTCNYCRALYRQIKSVNNPTQHHSATNCIAPDHQSTCWHRCSLPVNQIQRIKCSTKTAHVRYIENAHAIAHRHVLFQIAAVAHGHQKSGKRNHFSA